MKIEPFDETMFRVRRLDGTMGRRADRTTTFLSLISSTTIDRLYPSVGDGRRT